MGKYVIRENYNLTVAVASGYFTHRGTILKYKNRASKREMEDLNDFMICMKKLPKDLGQVIYTRYITLLKTRPTTDKSKLKRDDLTINQYYISKEGSFLVTAKTLGITINKAKELEYEAFELFADYLMEERLKHYKLYKHRFHQVREILNVDSVDEEMEAIRQRYSTDEIEATHNYCEDKGKVLLELTLYKYEWLKPDDAKISCPYGYRYYEVGAKFD